MRRIIDCHVHHLDDSQVEWAREIGYYRVCLMDPQPEVLQQALRKHPDFVIALGWLPMDADTPTSLQAVDHFREIGCRGYKICFTGSRYDDERYYPIYEKIQQTGMPIFFHTGWLYQQLAVTVFAQNRRPKAEYYHPMTLDRITLDFPRLKLVAFHLGGTYISDCALLMRNHPNIYADSCRGFDPPDFFYGQIGGQAGLETVFGKLVYGTDGMSTRHAMAERIAMFDGVMDHFKLGQGLRDRVWYKTALRILGMDEELKRTVIARKVAGPADLKQALQGTLAGPAAEGFVDRLGEKAHSDTRCCLGYTNQALQLAAFCRDDNPSKLAITPGGPLGDIWQDDCIEFFVSPTNDSNYFHIIANAGGRAFIHKGRYSEPEAIAAEVQTGPQGWAVKVEVPFARLSAQPQPTTRWGLNVCRNKASAPPETSSWNEVASTFHDPASFGNVRFE